VLDESGTQGCSAAGKGSGRGSLPAPAAASCPKLEVGKIFSAPPPQQQVCSHCRQFQWSFSSGRASVTNSFYGGNRKIPLLLKPHRQLTAFKPGETLC
jgi:hypothetical protein